MRSNAKGSTERMRMLGVLRCFVVGFVLLLAISSPVEACGCGIGSVESMLLSAQTVGPGFFVTNENSRTLEELAATFAEPQDAAIRLDAWGWQENAYRTYTQGPETVEISVHRFSSDHGAILALPYFVETRAAAFDLREVPQQPVVLGSSVRTTPRAVTGPVGEGPSTPCMSRWERFYSGSALPRQSRFPIPVRRRGLRSEQRAS